MTIQKHDDKDTRREVLNLLSIMTVPQREQFLGWMVRQKSKMGSGAAISLSGDLTDSYLDLFILVEALQIDLNEILPALEHFARGVVPVGDCLMCGGPLEETDGRTEKGIKLQLNNPAQKFRFARCCSCGEEFGKPA